MRRYVGAAALAVALAGGLAASVPSRGRAITVRATAGLDVHVTAQTRTMLTLGWTPQPGEGYQFRVDNTRVSNTWAPTTSSARFSIRSGQHVYEVEQLIEGLDGTVTNPAPTTTTVTVPTTTTVTTTVPTTTTQPGTTTTTGSGANLGATYLAATPGSVVTIPCGTYAAQTITGQNAGAVTLQATTPHCVVLGGLTLGQNNGDPSGTAPSSLTIDGIDVHGEVFGWYSDNSGATPGSTNFVYRNGHVWGTTLDSGIYLYSFRNALIQGVEVGPLCCNSDGIDMAIPRPSAPSPNGDVIDTVNVHDVYDSCSILAARLPGTPCSGSGFESGCSQCAHVDGSQWYGGLNGTIRNSVFTSINPGGQTGQGIFLQSANNGRFSNLAITGNTLGATPNNDLSISGPGTSVVTGPVNIAGNHVAGNIRLYGDSTSDGPFAPGVQITVTGNTAAVYQTTLNNGCQLILGDGSTYTPIYSANVFGNNQCQG